MRECEFEEIFDKKMGGYVTRHRWKKPEKPEKPEKPKIVKESEVPIKGESAKIRQILMRKNANPRMLKLTSKKR